MPDDEPNDRDVRIDSAPPSKRNWGGARAGAGRRKNISGEQPPIPRTTKPPPSTSHASGLQSGSGFFAPRIHNTAGVLQDGPAWRREDVPGSRGENAMEVERNGYSGMF
jgi:hypothetical protein